MRKKLRFLSSAALAFVLTVPAYAAGSGMPWEQPLQQILESVQGPVAQIVFGLSIAFAASSFFLSFFSFGGGALV
jgi:type IV secretion system protein TrbC